MLLVLGVRTLQALVCSFSLIVLGLRVLLVRYYFLVIFLFFFFFFISFCVHWLIAS